MYAEGGVTWYVDGLDEGRERREKSLDGGRCFGLIKPVGGFVLRALGWAGGGVGVRSENETSAEPGQVEEAYETSSRDQEQALYTRRRKLGATRGQDKLT